MGNKWISAQYKYFYFYIIIPLEDRYELISVR